MPQYENDSFLSRGLRWLQEQRQLHATHEIAIGSTYVSAAKINATVSQDEGDSTQDTVTLHKQIFTFVVRRCDLEVKNIRIQRGLKIWYLDDVYEITYKGRTMYEYNDPDRNDVVIYAVLVEDQDAVSIRPS